MPFTCQPFTIPPVNPCNVLTVGIFQTPLMDNTFGSLKSETPGVNRGSNQFKLEIAVMTEFEMTAPDAVSIAFCQVKEPVTWKPWLIVLFSCTSIQGCTDAFLTNVAARRPTVWFS